MKYLKTFESQSQESQYKIGEIVWIHCTPDKIYDIDRDVDEPMRIDYIRKIYDMRTGKTTFEYGVRFLDNSSDFEVMEDAIRKCTDYELNAYKYNV